MSLRRAALFVSVAFVAMGTCASASAQTLTMTADHTEVALGDVIRLQIECDSQTRPNLPDLSDFAVMNSQTSTQMHMTGGSFSVVARYTYVLQPTHEGRIAIAPASLVVGHQTFRSNPLTIVVGASGAARPPPSTGANTPPATDAPPATTNGVATTVGRGAELYTYDDRAFLRTTVDDTQPFVGEQVTFSLQLYVRAQLSQWPQTTQEPTTDGFWNRDLLPPNRSPQPTLQYIRGVPFYAYEMRRLALFPLREGNLTIGALSASVPQGSPFDALMGQASPDLPRTSVPVTITARPLPTEGRGPGPVLVGTATIGASLDRATTQTGDAVTLTVRVTGTGRVDGLELADLRVPGLRILAPHLETSMESPGDRVGGTRTFEWLIVPEQPGTFTIPSFSIALLDPVAGTFSAVTTTPLTLTSAGAAVVDPTASADAHPDTPEADETSVPLGPVRTQAALIRHRTHLGAQPWYPYALAAFPIGWVMLVLLRAGRDRMAAQRALPSQAKVAREAKKRLTTAEERAQAGDARGFYGALTLAISAVIEGKLGESVGALTHRELEQRLTARGMDAALAKTICTELEGADFARYSTSGAAPTEMSSALDRGRDLLGSLDRFVATPEDE